MSTVRNTTDSRRKKKSTKETVSSTTTHKNLTKQSNLKPKKSNKVSSKSPPFIPPPGKTSPDKRLSWESKSHRLEINPNPAQNKSRTMHIEDLSTTEDDEVRDMKEEYNHNIDRLLKEVSLKREEKSREHLNASRRLIEDQEEEIMAYKKDLDITVKDYDKAKRSLDALNHEVELSRTEAELLSKEKKKLLKKLSEVEIDGRETSMALEKMKDTCKKLKREQKNVSFNKRTIIEEKNILHKQLESVEESNYNLRNLLKEAQKRMELDQQNVDKCEILMNRLVEAEAKIQNQTTELAEKNKKIDCLTSQVEADKYEVRALDDLHKNLETTRAQLQNTIRNKESENERLSIRVKKMEEQSNSATFEVEHYQGLLAATRDKSVKDKEMLKKAARLQRDRAVKQEEINEELQKNVADALAELETAKSTLQQLTDVNAQLKSERDSVTEDLGVFKRNVMEIADIIELSSKSVQAGPLHVVEKLVSKVTRLKNCKTENENHKITIKELEDRLESTESIANNKIAVAETEVKQLKSAIDQYEVLTADYKIQLKIHREESESLKMKLEKLDRDSQRQLQGTTNELHEVRNALHNKTAEMEPYPDLLKTCEIRLQDAQERALQAEKRSSDHSRVITDITQKLEVQSEELEKFRTKYSSKSDQYKSLTEQYQELQKCLRDNEVTHRELLQSLGRKDENIQNLQTSVQEQKAKNDRLVLQLEAALEDSRRQFEAQKETNIAKERTGHARIIDLEAQLSRSTQHTEQIKRDKEEAERKFNTRLQDMRDRLEQANNTTKSMQTYVHFLKSTYANVFSDDFNGDFHDL